MPKSTTIRLLSPAAIHEMRERAERSVKLAKRNLNFVCTKYRISADALALNANISCARLEFILSDFDDITLDELLRLVDTLNVMCGLQLRVEDYLRVEFTNGKVIALEL